MDMALTSQSPLYWSDMDRQKIASRLIASYLQKEKGQSLFFQRESPRLLTPRVFGIFAAQSLFISLIRTLSFYLSPSRSKLKRLSTHTRRERSTARAVLHERRCLVPDSGCPPRTRLRRLPPQHPTPPSFAVSAPLRSNPPSVCRRRLKTKAALVPADAFGDYRSIRIYYVAPLSTLQDAMEKIKEATTSCSLTKAASIKDIFTSNAFILNSGY
nr:uncharacterized protein LOC127315543 [Lolium perenne]